MKTSIVMEDIQEERLRKMLQDKYMSYDKEKLVSYLVDITMVYAERFSIFQKATSMQDIINNV